MAAALAASQAALAALQTGAGDKDQLGSELPATKQRNAELEMQLATAQGLLADRDKELASLRGDLSAEMAKLKDAQQRIIRAPATLERGYDERLRRHSAGDAEHDPGRAKNRRVEVRVTK